MADSVDSVGLAPSLGAVRKQKQASSRATPKLGLAFAAGFPAEVRKCETLPSGCKYVEEN